MPNRRNFLLGHGERLIESVLPSAGGGSKPLPYTLAEAQARLRPRVEAATRTFASLPEGACPADQTVGVLTLHPQFIAKSYHPINLLRELSLDYVGSRNALVVPEKWTNQGEPQQMETTELFVSGRRTSFATWAARLAQVGAFAENSQIRQIESFRAPSVAERQRSIHDDEGSETLLEVALHFPERLHDLVLSAFRAYAESMGAETEQRYVLELPGLVFVPVNAPQSFIGKLTAFSFVRVVRNMPGLRTLHPVERAETAYDVPVSALPNQEAVDPSLRVAVFDGGLASDSTTTRWASSLGVDGLDENSANYAHGHNVTSAVLFGPLTPEAPAPRPFSRVDHYNVLDPADGRFAMHETLRRIREILDGEEYAFANLSLGPEQPIEDDEVDPWTATLDACLARGTTLLTVAAGNNGTMDRASGNARVQVPSDAVNALAIGAADSRRTRWARAAYSALGPGRCPGMVKPDLLSFGGDQLEPFYFAPRKASGNLEQSRGTSFAAPSALRLAVGVRAHFGEQISPLTLKALLIHCAEQNDLDSAEAGWGRIPNSFEELVVCPDNAVRVVYQGILEPRRAVRMPVPLPEDITSGRVRIEATFCTACPTDPGAPGTYTGCGFVPTFRPHSLRRKNPASTHPDSDAFFQIRDYVPEQSLRYTSHKWETVKHKSKAYGAHRLHRPAFDVHLVSRIGLDGTVEPATIPFALVLTVETPSYPDIYDRVVRAFAPRLEVLSPLVDIPIELRP